MNQNVSPLRESGQVAPLIDKKPLRHRYSKGVLTALSVSCGTAFVIIFGAGAATPADTQATPATGWYDIVGPIGVFILLTSA